MDPEAQLDAALAFVSALVDLVPEAGFAAEDYLASRGCLPAGGAVGCWVLPADACKTLAARIAAGPEAGVAGVEIAGGVAERGGGAGVFGA